MLLPSSTEAELQPVVNIIINNLQVGFDGSKFGWIDKANPQTNIT